MEICTIEIATGITVEIYDATSSKHITIDIPTDTEKPIQVKTNQEILIRNSK